jgi:hypothetical protein
MMKLPIFHSSARPSARAALLAALLVAGLASGCYNPFAPKIANTVGVSEVAPTPNTPRGVLDLFAWCWNNRAYDEYTEIFTDDFEFQFAATDSAGNAFRDRGLFRQDELDTARHLFIEGTANNPPAQKILLQFDRTFIPERDSRPGKEFPWHQEIKRNVVLSIDTGEQNFRITGAARFFVVRGDSADIPDELIQRGFKPDINRWYIERWEDETLETPALIARVGGTEAMKRALSEALAREAVVASAVPASSTQSIYDVTWGRLQAIYVAPR